MPRSIIPVRNIDNQILTIQLDSQLFRLSIWRQPADGWYCTIEHPPLTKIVSGRRMVLERPLLGVTAVINQINGDFKVVSTSSSREELGKEPWNSSHLLAYDF